MIQGKVRSTTQYKQAWELRGTVMANPVLVWTVVDASKQGEEEVDASKQGTVNEAAAAEVTASDATAAEDTINETTAALLAAAEGSSVSVLASGSEPQGAARQNTQQVSAQGTAVDAALQEQEHTDSSHGPRAAANGVREDSSLEDKQQLAYLLNCERIHVLQARTAALRENTAMWRMASVARIVKAWADQQLIQREIAALQAQMATLQGSQSQR